MAGLMIKNNVFYYHGFFQDQTEIQKCVILDIGDIEKVETLCKTALYDMFLMVMSKAFVKPIVFRSSEDNVATVWRQK